MKWDRDNNWAAIFVILILFSIAVMLFGGSESQFTADPEAGQLEPSLITPKPRTYAVSYSQGVFSPTNLHIHIGDTVVFRNDSEKAIKIDSALEGFSTEEELARNDTFSYKFELEGVYMYSNIYEEEGGGTIIVEPSPMVP